MTFLLAIFQQDQFDRILQRAKFVRRYCVFLTRSGNIETGDIFVQRKYLMQPPKEVTYPWSFAFPLREWSTRVNWQATFIDFVIFMSESLGTDDMACGKQERDSDDEENDGGNGSDGDGDGEKNVSFCLDDEPLYKTNSPLPLS